MKYEVVIDGKTYALELTREANSWSALLKGDDGQEHSFAVDAVAVEPDVLSLNLAGRSIEVRRESTPTQQNIVVNGIRYESELRDPRSLRSRRAKGGIAHGPAKITAPMPGKVVRIVAPEGTAVEAGQGVIVIEAMKMQNELKSPKKGIVKKISAAEGAAVNAGDPLAIIE